MRLLVVTHYFEAHRGGIERVAGHLAREWVRAGHQVRWAASACDPPPERPLEAVPMRAFNALERRAGLPLPIWGPRSTAKLAREIRRADLVVVHDRLYPGNVSATAIASTIGRPVAAILHVGEVPYRSPWLRAAMRAANRTVGRFVLHRAAASVCISENTRAQIVAEGVDPRTLQVVFNGVDTSMFKPLGADERHARRASLGIPADGLLMLFVGRFVEKKGMHILQQLVERRPDVHWAFIGWGPEDPGRWGVPGLRVLYDLPSKEVAAWMQIADLLVLPSIGEGFPMVVQEAMACGTPALCGLDSAAADPAARALLLAEEVDPGDVDGTIARWSRRIGELQDDPSRCPARDDVAEYASRAWSWSEAADGYLRLFERAIR